MLKNLIFHPIDKSLAIQIFFFKSMNAVLAILILIIMSTLSTFVMIGVPMTNHRCLSPDFEKATRNVNDLAVGRCTSTALRGQGVLVSSTPSSPVVDQKQDW